MPQFDVSTVQRIRPDSDAINGWSRAADLQHVSLNLSFDPARETVSGTVTSRFRGLNDGTKVLRLHAEGLQIESIRDDLGNAQRFEFDPPWLVVNLNRTLNRGDEVSLAVEYRVRPNQGLHFVKDAPGGTQFWSQGVPGGQRHWLPIWDYPNDRATFDARLRVGPGLIALSNGELIEVRNEVGGDQTYHWRTAVSLPTYLFAVAVGPWERYRDEWNGLPLDYYVPPGTGEERARRAFGETPRMLEFYSELLQDPFPFEKYGQVAVVDFPWGAMENASLSIYGDSVIASADELADHGGAHRNLIAHQLAHQWFGDLVTCSSWSHVWLHDAFASYLELLYQGHVEGPETKRLWLERYREAFIASPENRSPLVRDWLTPGKERASHTITKGPWVLYMIANRLGEKSFWNGVHAYLNRHREGLVTTENLVQDLFDTTGYNFEGWIEQWVEAGGYPSFAISYNEPSVRRGAGAMVLRVQQMQEPAYPVPVFNLDVDLDVYYEGGRKVRHQLLINSPGQDFRIPLEEPPLDIVFDPDCLLPCRISFDKGPVMWVHQAQLEDNAALQWRAVDALRSLIDQDPVGDVRTTLLWLLKSSPHPLLRERVALVCDFQAAAGHLIEAVVNDPSPQVRAAAAGTLRSFALNGSQRSLLQRHLFEERSPKTRAVLEAMLGVGE